MFHMLGQAMVRFILFEILFWTSIPYALFRGGAPERAAALIFVIDFTALPFLLGSDVAHRFATTEWAVVWFGIFAFVGLLLIALRSKRFWPLWMTAMQGNVVLSHLVSAVAPLVNGWTYGTALAMWSYLQLALLAAATWRGRHSEMVDADAPSWPGSWA